MKGRVIKLDRGYPLVKTDNGELVRCEHATALEKGAQSRAVIGDIVEVAMPDGHDNGIIERIEPRRCRFVRKDPTERTLPQVLAANFDIVLVAEPIDQVNFKRLERELVLAHETGAEVGVILTKADLAQSADEMGKTVERVRGFAGEDVGVFVITDRDPITVEAVRDSIGSGRMAVLIGKSGVGKSSLVNLLAGRDVRAVGEVREVDGKGRHTTVSRAIVDIPGGGSVVDMPGIRGLGLWDAEAGIEAAFADIEEYAQNCRFRDCKHENEPGCAVRAAVETGELSTERLASYRALKEESERVRSRRDEAKHMRGEKASDKKKAARASGRGKPKSGKGRR